MELWKNRILTVGLEAEGSKASALPETETKTDNPPGDSDALESETCDHGAGEIFTSFTVCV